VEHDLGRDGYDLGLVQTIRPSPFLCRGADLRVDRSLSICLPATAIRLGSYGTVHLSVLDRGIGVRDILTS
jgi:hypothetical protein